MNETAPASALQVPPFHVLIPARLGSTRLPEKALAELAGQPLVVHAWRCACRAGAAGVHVATDSERIAGAVRAAGGEVVMTAASHDSGTSRLAEAVERLALDDDAIVVNLQGDEPEVPAACLAQLAGLLADHPQALMATLWMPLDDAAQWTDPNVVKLVADGAGRALYFSRAPIPAVRAGKPTPPDGARRHVGLYAYRAGALRRWPTLPASRLEALEALEQLRALDAGWSIVCARAIEPVPRGIDTPADLAAARARLGER